MKRIKELPIFYKKSIFAWASIFPTLNVPIPDKVKKLS